MHVYVVDDHLAPVPLGAPGAIVFSGVCVGRGYINDPERTRPAFLADPHRPGQRLYQAGDFGRWRPDGKLEYFGRRDSQVKISGFRIEIGEIENTLLRVDGVRDGAVVVTERADQSRHLIAFYSGPHPVDAGVLRDRLGASLPGYMVPAAFHWRESLPLTANSKIDKKALTALAGELAVAGNAAQVPLRQPSGGSPPPGPQVLGVREDQVGRRDHFFDLGGTSLSAVKLAIALDRAVSLKDLTRHPVLADLAALIDGKAERRDGLLQTLAEPGVHDHGGRRPRPGVLPLRRRQRGELPVDGQRAARQRSGGLRRRAARSRPGRRERAVRARWTRSPTRSPPRSPAGA